jgi:hypothetical protein
LGPRAKCFSAGWFGAQLVVDAVGSIAEAGDRNRLGDKQMGRAGHTGGRAHFQPIPGAGQKVAVRESE